MNLAIYHTGNFPKCFPVNVLFLFINNQKYRWLKISFPYEALFQPLYDYIDTHTPLKQDPSWDIFGWTNNTQENSSPFIGWYQGPSNPFKQYQTTCKISPSQAQIGLNCFKNIFAEVTDKRRNYSTPLVAWQGSLKCWYDIYLTYKT